MAFYVYILASQRNGTLYIGMTDSLISRVSQHKQKLTPGFTSRYGVDLLVWYELHDTREGAFRRERQMKKWNRLWKLEMIERSNPGWRDLFDEIL
ncbi:MAG: GIY-YIG nuclease family protein [Caulobacter sp.]